MDTLQVVLAAVAAFFAVVAILALRHAAKHSAAWRDAQASLLEREGDRAAAREAASHARDEADAARDESRLHAERASKAEQDAAAMRAQLKEQQSRMQDFEAQKKQMIDAAKAAALETTTHVSNKLLADHKQENEAAKKQAVEVTAKMFDEFKAVVGQVKAMDRDNHALKGEVELMLRTMTHPGGAGKLAEVGLENLLKGFALEDGRDFETQLHIEGEEGALRPDAVVYLPQEMILVIDSKASKHMLDIVRHENSEQEAEHFARFLKTMNEHARGLARKDYRSAMERHCRKRGRGVGRMLSLMYFPSEAFIERVTREDPALIAFLNKSEIMLVGPTMLYSACRLASTQLAEVRRDDEREKIIEAVSSLMETVAVVIEAAGGMGKGIKLLGDNYNKLVGVLNRNALTRMKRLGKLKVAPAKGKAIPAPLSTYEIIKHDEVLDLEADDEPTDKVLAIRQG